MMTVALDSIPARWLDDGHYRFDEEGELQKRCVKCLQYYEPDTISFYASAAEHDGLHRWCKSCWRARRAQRIAALITRGRGRSGN